MDRGIVDERLLNKNIQTLTMYRTEEKKRLNKIYNIVHSSMISYESTNSKLMNNVNDKFQRDIYDIKEKRKKYINVLNRVLILYERLSNETKVIFHREEDGQ